MKLFSMDGKLLDYFNRITDLIVLNLLWLVCCLPVFTIGASTSALYQVTLQIAENKDSYISKSFFKAFRENFRQSTIVWLICFFLAVVLLSDLFIVSHFFTSSQMPVMTTLILFLTLLLVSGFIYLFPVIAYFKNSTRKIFINSFGLAFSHPVTTLQLLLLSLIPALTGILFHNNMILGSFLLVIIIPATTAFFQSVLLTRLFQKVRVIAQ